ncbi:hypothetical protein ONZ45_g4880 [Pleurotus djamor]|nr:hypothetical protein ONZ45_g4880 [Pleurotus djamor]
MARWVASTTFSEVPSCWWRSDLVKIDAQENLSVYDGRGGRGGRGRGRGRGRGGGSPIKSRADSGASTPNRGVYTPRRGGYDTPPNNGSARGGRGAGPRLRPDAPLSKLLYQERPYLRPIKFVKSVHTPTLFQNQDEVLAPIVESAGDEEASHVPTADQVARVFGVGAADEEELAEIDFNDLDKLAQLPEIKTEQTEIITEQTFTGIRMTETIEDPIEDMVVDQSTIQAPQKQETEQKPTFFIDTDPTPSQSKPILHQYDRVDSTLAGPLGQPNDDDEEEIVYVAPHPRLSSQPSTVATTPSQTIKPLPPTTSIPPQLTTETPSISNLKFSFAPSPRKQPRQAPVFTASARTKTIVKQRVRQGRVNRKKAASGFGVYGAMMSEAQLRGEEHIKDPRWDERRRGDSDIDWGDEDDEVDNAGTTGGGTGGGVIEGAEGMDVDPELEPDIDALRSFVRSMGAQASNQVTMDDVADMEMMRAEDEDEDDGGSKGSSGDEAEARGEDGESGSSDEELDAAVNAEEELIISESLDVNLSIKDDDEEEDDDDEDDEDESEDEDEDDPQGNFQARLQRIRSNAKGKAKALVPDSDDDEDEDEDNGWSRADEDDEFIEKIQALLDENRDVLKSGSRKQRKTFFRAIQDGDFDDLEEFNTPRRAKNKGNLPPELAAQWEKDRERKAENKRARAEARLILAADPFSTKKGGKKGRKAMLAAARVDPTSLPMENRIIDMQTLETQIRGFIRRLDGPKTMSLPPMRKDLRKLVHEMAMAFNLKSKSVGKGDARYTTLTKTTRSGIGINEGKINRIVRRSGGRGFQGEVAKGAKKDNSAMKMREGEEVGKAAPKIGESNLGFKMLASMGWAEGDKIGLSGGLEGPLTAIMKRTKLGLGAVS